MTAVKVIGLSPSEARWDWDEERPTLLIKGQLEGTYGRSTRVDPFPAYSHNLELVRAEVAKVTAAFPIDIPVSFYVLPFEVIGRTNGWCGIESDYRGNKPFPTEAIIQFSGKRIPPHPAMTRYLVAHEYGHAVEHWLERKRGLGDFTIRNEYQTLRGIDPPAHYGGGTWHRSTGELLANDFRILVCGVETEFWPHDGFTRPEQLPAVVEWWKKAKELSVGVSQ